jgi:GWxTD domain-containing protein
LIGRHHGKGCLRAAFAIFFIANFLVLPGLNLMAIFACLLALLFIFPASMPAQTPPPAPFVMNFDYSRFRHGAASGYLELYYSFYCGQLSLHPEGEHLKGGVALNTNLIDAQTGESVIKEQVMVPVVVEDTSAASWKMETILRQAGHFVPFGNYRLKVVAYDSADPARRDSLALPLEMKAWTQRPAIGDLELCSSIQASTNKSHPYFKNAHEVVPNPSLIFGALAPVVYVYTEFYDVDTTKTYAVDYEIVDQSGAVVKKVTRRRRYQVPNTVEIGTLNAVALNSGKYSLRLSLHSPAQAQPSQAQKVFYVYHPPVPGAEPVTATASFSPLANAVAALTEKEVEQEFQQVKYLADKTEIDFFSQLTTPQAKKDFLKEFWARREAGSLAEPPRRRIDYLRRVEVANEVYSQYTKKGWRTDRGRVFILYGKPDEIERRPSEGVGKPYEIWYFYQIEGGVQFVFVDRNGFGDYELVHSTKRNELYDDGWQRFLQ